MTELLKIMQQRQSCRSFADKKVEDEKIVACVHAASLAPSACNTQPYHFYICNTPETVAAAAEFIRGEKVNSWVGEAAAFAIVTQEHAELPSHIVANVAWKDFRPFDIGLTLENFCLEATEQGLGTCILGCFNEEKLKERFHIPSPKKIALIVALGYPADPAVREKKRRPLEETITYLR